MRYLRLSLIFRMMTKKIVLPTFFNAREMLDHQVSDFRTLFIGTCGHFLSMSKFKKEFLSLNKDFKLPDTQQ
jgi:hypothetical protein